MRYVFLIVVSIFKTFKIAKIHIILAQEFRENNTDFMYIYYVFSILIRIYLTLEIAKTLNILAQNFE
jgi:hypothetical protein